jgi:hypothetical protein
MTDSNFGSKGYFGGDVESGSEPPRKMSRIGSIPNKSVSILDADDGVLTDDIIYKSCSWQKVRANVPMCC